MPRKVSFVSLAISLGAGVFVLALLALSAAAAPPTAAPASPSGLPVIRVNYAHDWIELKTFANASVQITLKRGGTVVATATGPANEWGDFNSDNSGQWQPSRPDIQAGDTVQVATGGVSGTVDPIGEIEGQLDAAADRLAGAIHAPWFAPTPLTVVCEIWVKDVQVPPIVRSGVAANGGQYACDFSGAYDIVAGNDVAVWYYEPDGDQVINVFHVPTPDVAVEKWGEGNWQAGNLAIFRIQYDNRGGALAADVVLTDTLPAGATYVADTSGLPAVLAPGKVTWGLGPLAPGASSQFFVIVDNTQPPGSQITNQVDISTSSYGDQPDNNHREATVEVTDGTPDVNVGHKAYPGDPVPGDTYRVDVGYGNGGVAPAGPVTLHVQLAPGTSLQSWASENGFDQLWTLQSTAGGHLIFAASALPGQWGDQLFLTVAIGSGVPPDTQLITTVWIEAPDDADPESNGPVSQEVWTTASQRPDLMVHKQWSFGRLVPGGDAWYEIGYSNDGNVTQQSIHITDTLPSGTTLVGAVLQLPGGQTTPLPPVFQDGHAVAWGPGTLRPGQNGNLRVQLHLGGVAAGATITNTAEIGGVKPDRSPWNNHSQAVERVNASGPNLRLHKTSLWNSPDRIQFDLQFENVGTVALDNIRITDTLPADVIYDGEWWPSWWRDMDMNYNPATRQIVFTTSRLEPQWSGSVSFRVGLPPELAGQQGLVFTNTASITLPQADITPLDNTTTAVAFTGPDLYMEKSLRGGKLIPGGTVTFTITFGNRNNGPWATGEPPKGSPGIRIVDTLPAGMTFVSANQPWDPGTDWPPDQVDGNVLSWNMYRICPGCRLSFNLVARIGDNVPGLTQLTNVAEIASLVEGDVEPYYRNNRATWNGVVEAAYGLSLTPGSCAASGRPGAVVTHILRLQNTGNTSCTIDLVDDGHTWAVQLGQTQVTLQPKGAINVPVRVTVPPLAGLEELSDIVTITATVRSHPASHISSLVTTTAAVSRSALPLLLKR